MYIAGRLRTASMPPSTLIESAVYSPFPPLMAASFPFFALVSTMEVVISFVAIPLRGEAGVELSPARRSDAPNARQITEITGSYGIGTYIQLYHTEAGFSIPESRR